MTPVKTQVGLCFVLVITEVYDFESLVYAFYYLLEESEDQPTKANNALEENPISPDNNKSNSSMSPPASPASNQEEFVCI